MEIEFIKRKMRQLKICYHNPACKTVSILVDELNNKDNEIDRIKQENERLKRSAVECDKCGALFIPGGKGSESTCCTCLKEDKAKLIEALKPFDEEAESIKVACKELYECDDFKHFRKASQTMKEVRGE